MRAEPVGVSERCHAEHEHVDLIVSRHVTEVENVNFELFCIGAAGHNKRCATEIIFQKYIPPQLVIISRDLCLAIEINDVKRVREIFFNIPPR